MPQQVNANCSSTKLVEVNLHAAKSNWKTAPRVRGAASRSGFLTLHFAGFFAAICLASTSVTSAQDILLPAPAGMDNGAPVMSQSGGGSYFSQDLGTTLRLRYNTESYGQYGRGNFAVGSMPVWSFDDGSAAFFDGQVTLNELQGVGYNLGMGYRWLHSPGISQGAGRVAGASLWTDGTSTDEGNFFPQIGLSLESLGDMWDFRANGYLALGPQTQQGEFEATGVTGFQGNSISALTQAVLNTSFSVAEAEAARRLGSERDAWAFAGPYFVGNDDTDAVGYRLGVRGYAYPDLLLQVAVSDDEIFKTNATFSVTWFVGRTRTDFQPACGVPDRLREPVMRNDYVALSQSFVTGGIALTNPDGSALRIVHVDSSAGPGGDGTFENPFDMLTDVNNGGSLEGDIILAHAESVFTGDGSTMLKVDQRLLGEGDNFINRVATLEQGLIEIPETASGARALARPVVDAATNDAVVLAASGNEVTNFDFQNINGNAITGTGITDDIILRELDVTGGTDFAISLTDVATTTIVTFDEFTYDGLAGAAGGIQLSNFDGVFNATDSTLTNGTRAGVQILGDSDGTMSFASTVSFTSVDGSAVDIDGSDMLGGTITINGPITNDTNRSVSVQNVTTLANIDFNANITDTGNGIFVNSNNGGTITFATGTIDLEIDTISVPAANAITVTDNTGATIEFTGPVDIDNLNDANGLVATGGGTLRYSNTANSITTQTGRVVQIEDMTIAAQGVSIADINRTQSAPTSAVELERNTGGPIVLGNVTDATPGDSGTLEGGAADTVVINDSANVTISNVIINNLATFSGVHVEKTTAGTQTVNLNDLIVNDGDRGVEVSGAAGAGPLNMTINDTRLLDSTDIGLSFNNVDTGTMDFNNLDIDGNNVGGTGRGVVISDSNATFDFDAASEIREFDSTDFEVNNGSGTTSAGTITFAGDIINAEAVNSGDTSGRSVSIREVTGGTITFTAASSINDDNEGMLVEDNTGGTISFLGDNDFNTDANTAVTIDNNAGATIALSNLDITTDEGNGFVATNGGTLTVTGTTNTIDTDDGVGLRIEDMTIGVVGVTFQTVNVTSGDTNGIVLRDLTGSQVTVGIAGSADGAGGTLTTTSDAIIVENVANADFNSVQVANSGARGVHLNHTSATNMDVSFNNLDVLATTGLGMDVDHASTNLFNLRLNSSTLAEQVDMDNTGSGGFKVLLDNADITTAGGDIALSITFGATTDGDLTIRNDSDIVAANARAFEMFVNNSGTVVATLIEASTFTSAAAEDLFLENTVGAQTEATIRNNTFTNSAAANDALIRSVGSAGVGTRLDLNLVGNGDAASTIRLFTDDDAVAPFNFGVVDRDNVDANNPANVILDPAAANFEDIDVADVTLPNGP